MWEKTPSTAKWRTQAAVFTRLCGFGWAVSETGVLTSLRMKPDGTPHAIRPAAPLHARIVVQSYDDAT